MTTTRAEITAFLPGDVSTVLNPTSYGVSDGDIYFVDQNRERQERTEVQLIWGGRQTDEEQEDELRVYQVTMVLYRHLYDAYADRAFEEEMEEAAEALTAAYHNNPDRLYSAVTTPIDFVRCQEVDDGPQRQESPKGAIITQRIQLLVGAWESPRS